MAKQNLGGVYANMDFPPYVWQEYPKHIATGPHGKYEVAQNAADEERIRAKLQKDQDDAPAEPVHLVLDPQKEILISRAHELGVAINRKWSVAKLQQVVNAAEQSVDNLPAEGEEGQADETPNDPSGTVVDMPQEPIDETPKQLKDRLLAEAKALGIEAHHLWGVPRLKAAIAEAQAK